MRTYRFIVYVGTTLAFGVNAMNPNDAEALVKAYCILMGLDPWRTNVSGEMASSSNYTPVDFEERWDKVKKISLTAQEA